FEYRHGTGDGFRCFRVTVSPLGQGLRGSRHAYEIADITAQRQAEEALRAEQERLAAIINGTQVGTWEWNVQTGSAVINERWAQILGYTLDELAPLSLKTWEALVHPEDLPRTMALLQRHFTGEPAYYDCEYRMRHKTGQWVWVQDRGCVSTRTADGQPLLMFGSHTDITARKQMDAKLQESEITLQCILASTDNGILAVDPKGKVLKANQRFADLWRIPQALLEGGDDQVLLAYILNQLTDPEAFLKKVQQLYGSNAVDTDTLYFKDGRVFERHSVPLLIYGAAVGRVWSFLDITVRVKAMAEKDKLEEQNRQLEKAESLGRMAGAIAHHFNNQLQVVTGNLELAQRGSTQNINVAECLDDALQATRQASKISRLMLTYLGRTTAGQSPVDVTELCRQSLPLLQSALCVVLETDLAEPGPIIHANALQLQQMLTNLITNAAESGGFSQGAIRLFVKTVSAQEIPAAKRFPSDWQPAAQDYACLGVADAGCGISAQDLGKIFDPFFSSKFAGRGLGLPVVLG
ncbi:MAG: PAS domain-containing protein, partial [Armatimonadota bacterium]